MSHDRVLARRVKLNFNPEETSDHTQLRDIL